MIIFKTVRWKNFVSTGNYFTEIQLTRSPNTLIIGANGAGKSTILDALTFGLFGKPFRKINKPQLVNSINNGNTVVEVEFSIGTKEYKIVRGIKPNVFEIYCDSVLVNQDSKAKDYQDHLEKFILKLNYKSFTQVVVLGSASFVPFMQLSASDRRAIIEDLLDIQIFSSMNTLVKSKISEIKDRAKQLKFDMELTAEKIKLQKQNIEEHKKNSEDQIAVIQTDIKTHQDHNKKLEKDCALIQKHVDVLLMKISDKEKIDTKIKKLESIETKMETKIKKIKKDLEFYHNNDDCPTCKQVISEEFKTEQITQKNKDKTELEEASIKLESDLKEALTRLNDIEAVLKHVAAHNSEIVKHNASISAGNQYIQRMQNQITELQNRTDTLENDNEKLKELRGNLSEFIKKQEEVSIEKHYYDYAAVLLKDTGIKTKIIKQYLPIMNKLINKYLTAMDFFVNFNLNESFEETIKSRHRDEFTYDSFSEGEKMRIDLALLFTWRQIAKLKNSTNTNLLILDEVFDSSLDTVGTDEFLKLIHDMGADTNVFVISHKGDILFDKFRSVIKFEKKNNFSQVAK
jgi:DNA repair exonuclease SbcCD ATPase subunit